MATALSFSGRHGRRAALRGFLSIGFVSAITNLGFKALSRRTRPVIDEVPIARRLAKMPSSSSFPSGHSASAFAFATAVTQEKPALGIPLLGLAAAIGYSRIYTGVHYPSDVLAGALVGAAASIATRRFWPAAPSEPARTAPTKREGKPAPEGQGIFIAVNPDSGPALSSNPAGPLREALPSAEVKELNEDDDLCEILEEAVADGATALGVAGGDGSVNVAAGIALKARLPLLVVPSGTLNHFARDLGFHSVHEAIEAVKQGTLATVDVGLVDGRVFINTAGFGTYVDLVDARERLEQRIGKWPALAVAMVTVLQKAEPIEVSIDGQRRDVWMLFAGNCRYHPEGFAPAWRERLDDGLLDIRVVDATHPFSRTRLVIAILTGSLARSPVYSVRVEPGPIEVHCRRGPVRLAVDGETFEGSDRWSLDKSSQRLTVFAPS